MTLLQIDALTPADQDTLTELFNQLEWKLPRNKVRADYYDSKYLLRNLNIAIPPRFNSFESVIGWPAKAVDAMSTRMNLRGFVIPDQQVQDVGIDQIWSTNNMAAKAAMAHDSALIHSCAFVCTIQGDVASGEPPVLMLVRDANNATGLWNYRTGALKAALSIVSRDPEGGSPTQLIMYLPDRVLTMTRDKVGLPWRVDERRHKLGRVPVEPLVYRPRTARPFGMSRISRPVMSHTDSALRTMVRSEIGAEFYTTPQRYALNFPEEAFSGDGWKAVMGRLWTIEPPSLDEGIDPSFKPEVGQFPQMTMQPHLEQMRLFAQMFSSETDIPISMLGIVQDNPASAEAIYAAERQLIINVRRANSDFGTCWVRAMQNAFMLDNALSEVPSELLKLEAKWENPETITLAETSDAMSKQIASMPWLADTDVALEKYGYDAIDIERLQSARRKATVAQAVANLARPQLQAVPNSPAEQMMQGNGGGNAG